MPDQAVYLWASFFPSVKWDFMLKSARWFHLVFLKITSKSPWATFLWMVNIFKINIACVPWRWTSGFCRKGSILQSRSLLTIIIVNTIVWIHHWSPFSSNRIIIWLYPNLDMCVLKMLPYMKGWGSFHYYLSPPQLGKSYCHIQYCSRCWHADLEE